MFGTIRKHQNWLWAVIIVVIIISFVIFFSPDVGFGRSGAGGAVGYIDGKPVSQQDFRDAALETRLLYLANTGKWPESDERARQSGFDLENEAQYRLIRLAKLKQEKIVANDQTVGQLALAISQRIAGQKATVDDFVRGVLQPQGITEADFERFLRHEAAMQQLISVVGLPGKLVPPREMEEAYRRENQEYQADAVIFNASNYLGLISVTDSNLTQWYSNRMAEFRIPEKARVAYVEFHQSNHLAEVDKRLAEITNLSTIVEQIYNQDPTSYKDDKGLVLPKEAALAKIKNDNRNRESLKLAERKANEFASKFYDEKDHTVAGLEKFATAQGLKVNVTDPFEEMEGPAKLNVAEDFARLAFTLTNREEAVSFKAIPGDDAFYIIATKEILTSSNPKFEDIRAKVLERYKMTEAQRMAYFGGMAFQSQVTNGLAQGKTFTQIATEGGQKVVSLPTFSRAAREVPELPANINLRQIQNVVGNLEVGKASPFVPGMGGGFILYLRGKMPIDEPKMKKELGEYTAMYAMQKQNEAFGLWFRKQMERVDLPITRKQAEQQQGKQPGTPKAPAAPKAK